MDFKTWNKQKSQYDDMKKKAEKAKKFADDISKEDADDMEKKFDKLKNKNESELMQEMLKTASDLKKQGKLSKGELEEFYSRAKGFLNQQQLDKLKKLLKMLGV